MFLSFLQSVWMYKNDNAKNDNGLQSRSAKTGPEHFYCANLCWDIMSTSPSSSSYLLIY